MAARIEASTHRPRFVLMASKAPHCFHDLVLRWKAGERPISPCAAGCPWATRKGSIFSMK